MSIIQIPESNTISVHIIHAIYLLQRSALLPLLLLSQSVFANSLPRPPGLDPDIAFWRRIFTAIGSDQALRLCRKFQFIGFQFSKNLFL